MVTLTRNCGCTVSLACKIRCQWERSRTAPADVALTLLPYFQPRVDRKNYPRGNSNFLGTKNFFPRDCFFFVPCLFLRVPSAAILLGLGSQLHVGA